MQLARQWNARYATAVRFQALPRNRRLIGSSSRKSAVAALKREAMVPGVPNNSSRHIDGTKPPVQSTLPSSRYALIRLLETPLSDCSILSFSSVVEQYLRDDDLMSNVGFCELFAQTAAYFRDDALVTRIMETGRLHGVTFTTSGYENVLRQWIRNSKWVLAHHLSELLIETPSLLSSRVLRFRAQALSALRMYDSLRGLLDLHTKHHIVRTRRLYNVLIRASLEAGDLQWARSLLGCMKSDGFVFDGTTYSSMLAGYRALGPHAAVESRIYRDLRQLGLLSNPQCLNALLRSRLDAGDIEGARVILSLFHDHTDTSDADRMYAHRSALLDGNGLKDIDANSVPSAASTSRTPRNIPLAPPSPEISTFNILLSQCAKLGDTKRAVMIWNRILALGLAPTAHTVVAVIRNLHAQPSSGTAQAQAVTFIASVIYGAESNRAAKFCERLRFRFTTCEFNPCGVYVQPSTFIFDALLPSVLEGNISKGLRRMEGLLEEMTLAGVEPNTDTVSMFVKHVEKHAGLEPDELSSLIQALRECPSALFNLMRPSSLSSEQLLPVQGGCQTRPEPPPALPNMPPRLGAILRTITRRTREAETPSIPRGLTPSSRGSPWWYFKASSSALCVSPRLHTAASNGTVDSNARPTTLSAEHLRSTRTATNHSETWVHLIRTASSTVAAQAHFDRMRAQGFIPKAKHYVALIQSYASMGHVDQAARVLASVMAAGILTSIAMFTVLIVAYGSLGRPELAHHTFNQMRKQPHLSPDVASIDALARAYIAAGRAADARNVILQHWADVDKSYMRRTPEFMDRLRTLTLKGLMYALGGLGGAQRKGGRKPVSQARRIATQRIVRRVVRQLDRNTPGPKKPSARTTRNIASEEI